MFSQEYIASIALVIVGLLKVFGIEIANDAITGILTGGVALYIAFRRYQKGDISLSGVKKY